VAVDIGGDVGALIIYTPEPLAGSEIEIAPIAGGAATHTAVRERRLSSDVMHAAVFPGLPAGDYLLPGGPPVTVGGGSITEVHW
jgi:hypothetical protein